jgi:hypothetical protein
VIFRLFRIPERQINDPILYKEQKDTNVGFDQNDSIKFNTGVYNKHIVCAQFSFNSKIIYAIFADILMSFHSFRYFGKKVSAHH